MTTLRKERTDAGRCEEGNEGREEGVGRIGVSDTEQVQQAGTVAQAGCPLCTDEKPGDDARSKRNVREVRVRVRHASQDRPLQQHIRLRVEEGGTMSASEKLCRYCGAFVNVPRGAPYRYLGTVLFPEPPAGMSAEEYHEHARCVDVEPMREEQSTCRYSLRHAQAGVVATTTIDCGPVGIVPACEACAAFYARNSS